MLEPRVAEGFLYSFFHARSGSGSSLEPEVLSRFDQEYALLNTLFVLVEPFYYMAQLKREFATSMFVGLSSAQSMPRTQV